jgi:hypothetical protein
MVLALAYGGVLIVYSPLTADLPIDGAIGVVLGLYVCSHPAANVLDLLFSDGGISRNRTADEQGIMWYFLNLLVLMAGWFTVWTGLTRFTT